MLLCKILNIKSILNYVNYKMDIVNYMYNTNDDNLEEYINESIFEVYLKDG